MMVRSIIISVLTCVISKECCAQQPSLWNSVQSGQSIMGLILNDSETRLIVWGNSVDSCFTNTPSFVVMDTNGLLVLDTSYEFSYCRDEGAFRLGAGQNGGYYLVNNHDAITPGDSAYVHFIDDNFAIQWSEYLGRNVRSDINSYNRRNYISVDDNGQNLRVLRFYQPGDVDTLNQVAHPYFSIAPLRTFSENGLVLEFGQQFNNDSAFVCLVYDTLGNFFTSFSFDADPNQNEVPWYVSVNNNRVFHVCTRSSLGKTYLASSGLTGLVDWRDTISHQMHFYNAACLDTINQVAYVLCDGTTSHYLFSYDLLSGSPIDSIEIDSLDLSFSGIKSGNSGGVFLFYNKYGTDSLILDQYDAHFDLIWRGYALHPTCIGSCNPYDFVIDSLGYVYTVSDCPCMGEDIFVSKFAPSLVSVPENNLDLGVSIFPNPASSEVRIQLNEQSGNYAVNIINSVGQTILTKSFFGNNVDLSLENLPSGLYFVEVTADSGQRVIQKLIIQHP